MNSSLGEFVRNLVLLGTLVFRFREDYDATVGDSVLSRAERLSEIIGEVGNKIDLDFKTANPHVEGGELVKMPDLSGYTNFFVYLL